MVSIPLHVLFNIFPDGQGVGKELFLLMLACDTKPGTLVTTGEQGCHPEELGHAAGTGLVQFSMEKCQVLLLGNQSLRQGGSLDTACLGSSSAKKAL